MVNLHHLFGAWDWLRCLGKIRIMKDWNKVHKGNLPEQYKHRLICLYVEHSDTIRGYQIEVAYREGEEWKGAGTNKPYDADDIHYWQDLPEKPELPENKVIDTGGIHQYYADISEWEASFNCSACGLDNGKQEYTYSRKVASGECWKCPNCKNEIQVGYEPNEDNY